MSQVPNLSASVDGEYGGCICCSPDAEQNDADRLVAFRLARIEHILERIEVALTIDEEEAVDTLTAMNLEKQ